MANGMMNDPNAPMGGQPPMGAQPEMGAVDDAVLDMHLTEDVKKALQSKGVDVSAVQDRGPKEPVIVIPVSVIINRYQAATPEESMKQFVQDMTANAKPPAAPQPVSAPSPMAAEAPNQEGLGAPMNRPPMTA
tara:strand:+ start:160 stop:558 length:399 start_codon:yes stop_codon:yes gene_type:complete